MCIKNSRRTVYSALSRSIEGFRVQGLLSKGRLKVLVAVSGGVDSMVLLDALHRHAESIEIELEVAHVNHRLRKDADDDAAFVSQSAKALGVHCSSYTLTDAPERNIESWARAARYQALEEIRLARGAEVVFTAHHLDDQAETFLMRLCSGRLITSVNCIEFYSRERSLARPLLNISRKVIEAYASECSIQFREDAMNRETCFLRNRVRGEVLPLLREVFSDTVGQTLVETLGRLQQDEIALRGLQNLRTPEHELSEHDMTESFEIQDASLQRILSQEEASLEALSAIPLFEFLPAWRRLQFLANRQIPDDAHRIGFADYQRVLSSLETTSSNQRCIQLGAGIVCIVERDLTLKFGRATERNKATSVPEWQYSIDLAELPACVVLGSTEFSIRLLSPSEFPVMVEGIVNRDRCYVDQDPYFESDTNEPQLQLRTRRAGDWIQLPRRGRRTIKKLLPELNISADESRQIAYLASGTEVLWIPNSIRSERRTPQQRTRIVLEICSRRMAS